MCETSYVAKRCLPINCSNCINKTHLHLLVSCTVEKNCDEHFYPDLGHLTTKTKALEHRNYPSSPPGFLWGDASREMWPECLDTEQCSAQCPMEMFSPSLPRFILAIKISAGQKLRISLVFNDSVESCETLHLTLNYPKVCNIYFAKQKMNRILSLWRFAISTKSSLGIWEHLLQIPPASQFIKRTAYRAN